MNEVHLIDCMELMKGKPDNYYEITGHPRYEINIYGEIRNRKSKMVKKQYLNDAGYYMISVSYNNKSKPFRVHRLIAKQFIPNKKEFPEINHINGIKTDNRIENLEWCTHEYNVKHAFRTGLVNNTGERNGKAKLKKNQVVKIKQLLKEGKKEKTIAELYNVTRSCIASINQGRHWGNV